MKYLTYQPHPDLAPLVKCYWTLEVPKSEGTKKQRIIPDGCIEMAFILGDDIRRYTSDNEFIIQPRAMVLGQITEPFFIKPTGYVESFSVSFYPYGFANFITRPIVELANKETPLTVLFAEELAKELDHKISAAKDTQARIEIAENFLFDRLREKMFVDGLVKKTIDTMLGTKGSTSIRAALKSDASKRRQLERKFARQIGISPKQLGKVFRLQAALKMMLNQPPESLTTIAYSAGYYDQAHFNKDFKEFTGTTPKEFFEHEEMALSSLLYK